MKLHVNHENELFRVKTHHLPKSIQIKFLCIFQICVTQWTTFQMQIYKIIFIPSVDAGGEGAISATPDL